MEVAQLYAKQSKCASRQVGAVIVRGQYIIAGGFNGSPKGVQVCNDRNEPCRRKVMGYKSGEGLEHCPAVHAEQNAIFLAAREGISTEGTTLFVTSTTPCASCMGAIINCGIRKVVCLPGSIYSKLAMQMAEEAGIIIEYYVPANPQKDKTIILEGQEPLCFT